MAVAYDVEHLHDMQYVAPSAERGSRGGAAAARPADGGRAASHDVGGRGTGHDGLPPASSVKHHLITTWKYGNHVWHSLWYSPV